MKEIFLYFLIGFAAQFIDGSMGMAYGVSCNTFLRTVGGVPAPAASASVHFAEMFTTLASSVSHIRLKNVSRQIFLRLLIPGVIGGALGAYLLSDLYSDRWDVLIDAYLFGMGCVVLSKLFRRPRTPRTPGRLLYPLGFVGGFCDAVGGGGWGPVVTSTLVASDHDVRTTVGSVNTAEFFVTVAESAAFFLTMRADFLQHTGVILGLVLGGVAAAPLAALVVKRIPLRLMLALVGGMIVCLNGYSLIMNFAG